MNTLFVLHAPPKTHDDVIAEKREELRAALRGERGSILCLQDGWRVERIDYGPILNVSINASHGIGTDRVIEMVKSVFDDIAERISDGPSIGPPMPPPPPPPPGA